MFRNIKALLQTFTTSSNLTAKKYLRSVSETALLYRPLKLRELTPQENLKDRVVQTFFDTSNIVIKISEAQDRLNDMSFSTPAHSFYQFLLPFHDNNNLRRKMIQFSSNHIRIGRMLELMDYMAANVAYRYCTPEQDKYK